MFKVIGSIFTALLAAMALASCGGPVACPAGASPALAVTVLNASGDRVCDAAVTATDGEYSVRLPQPHAGAEGLACRYFGPYDRPGSYTVHVRLGSLTKTVSNIVVSRPATYCRVGTQQITVRFS
jgi:hypothetical protein